MLIFPKGHQRNLIYLDTNVLSEIAKNHKNTAKIFLSKFVTDDSAFVTTAFNIYELSNSTDQNRENIIKFFDGFPLLIIETFPQLIEHEKNDYINDNDLILFAVSNIKINRQYTPKLRDFFDNIKNDKETKKSVELMKKQYNEEIISWKATKENNKNPKWMKQFENNLLNSMNETFLYSPNVFTIKELHRFKSLEVLSFIKMQFIHSTNDEIDINSVIDAYNTSILPYVSTYITEKRVAAWLEVAKDKLPYLKNKVIIKISSLFDNNF